MDGVIKRIIAAKGFGFIEGSDGVEYFFHRSESRTSFDSFREGNAVEFTATSGEKGPRAVDVEAQR